MNWRQMVLDTGRALMDIARTNRVILGRYREELDELRAFRLAALATERELRDEIDVLYADAAGEGDRVGGLARKVAELANKHSDMAKSLGERVDAAESNAERLERRHVTLAKHTWECVDALEAGASTMECNASANMKQCTFNEKRIGEVHRDHNELVTAHIKLGDTVIALGEQVRRADDAAKVRLDALEATIKAGTHTLQMEPWTHGRSPGGTVREAEGAVILRLDRLTLCEGDADGV